MRFIVDYERNLAELRKDSRGFDVFRKLRYDVGVHPEGVIDYECEFAAYHVNRFDPNNILDIGSNRHFLLGLLAHFQVTTIDIRSRRPVSDNEVVIVCDAKNLNLPGDSFDVVVSLCVLEHIGLGRYGDEFDLDADRKAFKEMIRVLRPGGHLIFSTTITRGRPSIAFNAHKIYSYEMIRRFCASLTPIEEKFCSHKTKRYCSFEEVTTEPRVYDVYCGCWKKKQAMSPSVWRNVAS